MSRITSRTADTWVPRLDRQERLESAVSIAAWATSSSSLYQMHRHELLSIACWKASELDGKWFTRYRSKGVVEGEMGTLINHEHVVPRLALRTMILAYPDCVKPILFNAVACLVTRDEHSVLNRAAGFGWERYINAGVAVLDMADLSALDLPLADAELKRALAPFRR